MKNLNSFRFLKLALDHEIDRQVARSKAAARVHQETRLVGSRQGETVAMRSKEEAHDYRYFPEPDLVPLRDQRGMAATTSEPTCRSCLPQRAQRFIAGLRLARVRCRRC